MPEPDRSLAQLIDCTYGDAVCADDKAETDHLHALAAGAGEGRLSIFRCDLLDGAALLDVARGCAGVFHLALALALHRRPRRGPPGTYAARPSVPQGPG